MDISVFSSRSTEFLFSASTGELYNSNIEDLKLIFVDFSWYHDILFRVISLTIVIYRVMMVCHVEFCYVQGERVIRNKLFR